MDVKKQVNNDLINALPSWVRKDISSYLHMENLYESAIKEICTRLEILNSEYESRFDRNPIHHIENRVKSPDSILKKLKKYGFQLNIDSAMTNINDIAGVRVVCYYVSDVYEIADILKKCDDIEVMEEKDYINHPKKTGYRSLHLILKVPVYTVEKKKYIPVEIQLRTIAMDYFASIEHQLKYKTRLFLTDELNKELTDCADIIAKTDTIMENIYNKIK